MTIDETYEHFTEENWADFARDVASTELAQELHAHLRRGCESCSRAAAIWKSVVDAANRERSYDAPEEAVQAVRNAFSLRKDISRLARQALTTRVIFDNFQEPVLAGLRGSALTSRHLLYAVGDFQIHLWLAQETEIRVWIAGHVHHRDRQKLAGGASVVFVLGDDVIAQTTADANGEFLKDIDYRNGLRMFVILPDVPLISIVLPENLSTDPASFE